MDAMERRLIEWECAKNTVRFYNRLDGVRGEEASQLFTEDGVWYREGDESAAVGRAQIAAHVNKLPQRGDPNADPALKVVFHLVTNVEVKVVDDDTAEVWALTTIIPGVRNVNPDLPGTSNGVVAVFPTSEVHKRTPDGWRIASKKTARALRIAK
jgi:hypothetical protein